MKNLLPPHDVWHLATRRLGKRVWCFPRLDSTNSLALALANDAANDGLVLLAHEQTSGRGQYGRTWSAPPGSSVLCSVLVFPPLSLRQPALLTAWAAVAVCETILEITGLEATIKWPNDVLVEGKKVCGILIEQRNTGQRDWPLAAAVGLGLNVRQSAEFFARADLPLAASLASLSGKEFPTRLLAECLIGRLDAEYERLVAGESERLEAAWQARLGLVGQPVIVEFAQGMKEGRLLDVTWQSIALDEGGEIVHIPPETVRGLALRCSPPSRPAR